MGSIPKPVVLLVLDGFGISPEKRGNAILAAKKPNLDKIEKKFPFTLLQASGLAVGLPWDEPGNSEVGHLTMGAGRAIYHHLPRIIAAIQDGSFFKNPAFLGVIDHIKRNNSTLHLLGLVSSGSVHSYLDHLYALFELAKRENVARVFLHAITDGRDAPPEEAASLVRQLEARIKGELPQVTLVSLLGRFCAMDRDLHWDRIRQAYEAITLAKGAPFEDPVQYLKECYGHGITDEFIPPAYRIKNGSPLGRMGDGDGLIIFNFREDSMREIAAAFAQEPFQGFLRERWPSLKIATMTEYDKNLPQVSAAFEPLEIYWPLARVLAEGGRTQFHIAESEKYAHVTYFFNGGVEKPFTEEERMVIPSVAVPHFDDQPAMRTPEITAKILERLGGYDFILANFANADMVGHTGNFQAVVQAIEALDHAVGAIADAVVERGGTLVVTSDHGNAEQKIHPFSGETLTEHTSNPVPFYIIGREYQLAKERSLQEILAIKKEAGGILADVAPTILEIMRLHKPDEMTGKSLLPVLLDERR